MKRRRKRRKKKRRRKVYFKATSFIFGKDLGATARRGEGCDLRTGCDLSLTLADQELSADITKRRCMLTCDFLHVTLQTRT
jgi:hypothetical protein